MRTTACQQRMKQKETIERSWLRLLSPLSGSSSNRINFARSPNIKQIKFIPRSIFVVFVFAAEIVCDNTHTIGVKRGVLLKGG